MKIKIVTLFSILTINLFANLNIPHDATNYQGNSYKVFNEDISWDMAKKNCERLGGHLAYAEDKAESKFLWSLSKKKPVWLGGEFKNGKCHWGNGKKVSVRNAFGIDRKKNKNCFYVATAFGGELRLRPLDGHDVRFRTPRITGYICEWENTAEHVSSSTNENTSVNTPQSLQIGMTMEQANMKFKQTDIHPYLVIIDCGSSVGSGFIASELGQTYVYTNQHVVFGISKFKITTLEGVQLKPQNFQYSKNRDIIRFKIENRPSLKFSQEIPPIDSTIGVYGNSAGGGVVTQIFGEINGIGPDRIEVNAPFVQGNSGSPIVNKNMEIVGIATYATRQENNHEDWVKADTRFNKVRRFGYRFNNVVWKTNKWNTYTDYSKNIQDIEKQAGLLYSIAVKWANEPFKEIESNKKYPSGLRAWISSNNGLCQKREKLKESLNNSPSRQDKKLEEMNKTISRHVSNNSKKLSDLCLKLVKKSNDQIIKEKELLSQFQIDELKKHSDFMKYLAKGIQTYAKKLSRIKSLYYE